MGIALPVEDEWEGQAFVLFSFMVKGWIVDRAEEIELFKAYITVETLYIIFVFSCENSLFETFYFTIETEDSRFSFVCKGPWLPLLQNAYVVKHFLLSYFNERRIYVQYKTLYSTYMIHRKGSKCMFRRIYGTFTTLLQNTRTFYHGHLSWVMLRDSLEQR